MSCGVSAMAKLKVKREVWNAYSPVAKRSLRRYKLDFGDTR